MTEQIELKEKVESERRHLTAVVGTTIGTTLFLFALMVAIALAPVPNEAVTCFKCCHDDSFCTAVLPPPELRPLAPTELEVVPAASSGYSLFLGEVQHTCYCPRATSVEELNEKFVQEFLFQYDPKDANSKALSLFSNLLDGSPDTFWCSLPQGLISLLVSRVPALKFLSVTFPQFITLSANINNGGGELTYGSPTRGGDAEHEESWSRVTSGGSSFRGAAVRRDVPQWVNVTAPVTLCCGDGGEDSAWQWVPFNGTDDSAPNSVSPSPSFTAQASPHAEVPTSDYGRHAVFRLNLIESFGNPHRISLSGFAVYV
eukprot:CAMPEP_0171807474 /NCGR_PEP_ID=MMETSP0991-20121206/75852_1 /TAXON_ID=483369 /ORGANISM="non described non described, Strain CCMP2098" /LENGTH=314 /DNA_ID=CAMNT_0012420293 /DNA_START=161 /DNA_END=1102 /DNA_ORIENTATION=+